MLKIALRMLINPENIDNQQDKTFDKGLEYKVSSKNRWRLTKLKRLSNEFVQTEGDKKLENLFLGYFDFRNNIYDLYNHDSAEKIAPLVYDTNLLKSVKWVSPEGRKIELDGQIFLNRSALMYTIYQRFFSLNDQDKYEYNGKPFAILMMDIENFASTNIYDEVNHTYGGDIVINQIVEQIKQTIKSFELDYKEALANVNITAARYGGDEFMFLVEGEVEDELILRFEAQLKAYISELSAFL